MKSTFVEQFWQRYLHSLPDAHAHRQAAYTAWGFGDSAAMQAELGALVVLGVKRATASLTTDYADRPLPFVGELSVILGGDDEPLCVIETVEVQVQPFGEVDEQFAYDEGEGERTLDWWRAAHQRYWQRSSVSVTDETPIVCERFRVVFLP